MPARYWVACFPEVEDVPDVDVGQDLIGIVPRNPSNPLAVRIN